MRAKQDIGVGGRIRNIIRHFVVESARKSKDRVCGFLFSLCTFKRMEKSAVSDDDDSRALREKERERKKER